MKTPKGITRHIPEVLVTEILARLPLKAIWRLKSVCKTWNSILESVYFRRLFLSMQRNSTSSWSLMHGINELMRFHGDLPMSLIPPSFKRIPYSRLNFNYYVSSNGLVLIEGPEGVCYVGNPYLQQWVEIPSPPNNDSTVFGLVTGVDDDGVVLSFKVIRLVSVNLARDLSMFLFSSETGIWTSKLIHCPYHVSNLNYINLNGKLYFCFCHHHSGAVVSLDFYSESDQSRVVQFPDHSIPENPNPNFRRASLTTSGGFLMYMKTSDNVFKAWKLMNDSIDDDKSWQLLWQILLPVGDYYTPMAMHPFDTDTVYLWSQQNRHFVLYNLGRQSCTILLNDQDCFMDQSVCNNYINNLWSYYGNGFSLLLKQFVLPLWMESLPCPPQVEMIDTTELLGTTSLLSYIASMEETRKRNIEIRKRSRVYYDDFDWIEE